MALEDHMTRRAVHENVRLFPLWIIDEIDFGRFVLQFEATESDLSTVVSRYPDETSPQAGAPLSLKPVKELAQVLLHVLADLKASDNSRLNGTELYKEIDTVLADSGTSLTALVSRLVPLSGRFPAGHWAEKSRHSKVSHVTSRPTLFPYSARKLMIIRKVSILTREYTC